MPSERQEIWELTQQVKDLKKQLDDAGTETGRLTNERDQAIKSRYAEQEEAVILRNQLSAKEDENERLNALLKEAGSQLQERAQSSDETNARALRAEGELLGVREEFIRLQSKANEDHLLTQELFNERRFLLDEISNLNIIREEKDQLVSQNKYLLSQNNLLKSQVGNFLVGIGRVNKFYYVVQFLGHLPIMGAIFRQTSLQIYEECSQKKTETKK